MDLSVQQVADWLVDRNYLLTALELHAELLESGNQSEALQTFFSNPGNFARDVTENLCMAYLMTRRSNGVHTFITPSFCSARSPSLQSGAFDFGDAQVQEKRIAGEGGTHVICPENKANVYAYKCLSSSCGKQEIRFKTYAMLSPVSSSGQGTSILFC